MSKELEAVKEADKIFLDLLTWLDPKIRREETLRVKINDWRKTYGSPILHPGVTKAIETDRLEHNER